MTGVIAPRVGLEPTTPRLTAACSTIELSRNGRFRRKRSCEAGFADAKRLQTVCKAMTHFKNRTSNRSKCQDVPRSHTLLCFWKSNRPISNGQLHTLLHFHLHPIYPVLFRGSPGLLRGYLILGPASRLDAFSVYPFRIWLPCYGIGCQQVHQ